MGRHRLRMPNTLPTFAGDLTALQHADVAALAAVMALLPVENADEGEQDADEQALSALSLRCYNAVLRMYCAQSPS